MASNNDRHQFIEWNGQQITVGEYKRRKGMLDNKDVDKSEQDKKEELVEKLKEYDIYASTHWNLETLEEKLEEAKKENNEDK